MSKNAFDPYREALVVEVHTIWPDEFDSLEEETRLAIEQGLHAKPQAATVLEYVRMHTGFAREITVTEADVKRLKK